MKPRRSAGHARATVSASELAQMGRCERLVVLERIHGKRTSLTLEAARRRGIAAHARFEREGRLVIAAVGGPDRRCGLRSFIAAAVLLVSGVLERAARAWRWWSACRRS